MSSSANRRPRVAGQRRRPARDTGPAPSTESQEAADPTSAGSGAGSSTSGTEDTESTSDEPREESSRDLADDGEEQGLPADAADDAAADDTGVAAPGQRRLLVPAVALALSLALLAAVLVVTRGAPDERPRAASAAVATARSTLEQILSYNHATMTQQLPASQALLTGAFRTEFGETMTKTIVPLAQKDKTVVKARVYEAGVMSQSDRTVTVQAFVNQAKTSDAQKEPSIDQNRVIATMTKVGDRWLVSALKAY